MLIKRSAGGTGDWHLYDIARTPNNVSNQKLFPNTSQSEEDNSYNQIDMLSNGFKLRDTDGSTNASGNTYIYIAFASNPFGGDGVSPATAR